MIYLSREKRPSFFILWVIIGIVVTGMLYFGIRLKGFTPDNNLLWHSEGGLAFKRFAVAYTDSFFSDPQEDSEAQRLTIEMVLHPELSKHPESIKFILLIHAGEDQEQLVIGQWRTVLMIMNGNDYSNSRRTPKIYMELNQYESTSHLFTIVSNGDGTKVFVDGKLMNNNPALVLKYPNDGELARMIIGNSLSGKRPWTGTMIGLALYDHDLADEDVKQHYRKWAQNQDVNAFRPEKPQLLYAFHKGKGKTVENRIGNGLDLIVPDKMTILQRKLLTWPKFTRLGLKSISTDILVNVAGFMPLGFILFAAMVLLDGIGDRTGMFITIMIAFLFSLTIEIAQAWIPSRDSSILDLTLNTLGSGAGALLFYLTGRRYMVPDR